ncbi:MAG: hypothetical protein IAG13_19620, partial [Deltaproteobacteria bacterium]|nr:hypothetical protein [Nannocystaceae bacterium]
MDAPSPRQTWRPDALAYPWAARPNPATVATAHATERWVTAHGLLDDELVAARYRAVSVAALAGLTHPLAEPALLELVAALMGWIFIEDDRYDLADGSGRAALLAGRFDSWLDVLATRRV